MSLKTDIPSMQPMINPTTHAKRRYIGEFAFSMTAYVALIFLSRWLWPQLHGGAQVGIALMPIIPMCFIFASVVRYLLATDELERQITVQSLALAGGATALLSVTYGLLEGSALPRPSVWWTYTTFMVGWMVAYFFVRRRYK